MRPTVAQLRPVGNPILTGMLTGFMNDDMDYVARRAAPPVAVNEESGTFITFPKGFWLKSLLERRAYGDTYARGGYEVSSDTYKTLQWGLEHPIPDEHKATSQVPMSLEQVGAKWLANQSNIRKELSFATDFMVGSVWTGHDNNSATDWDSTGTPITNVQTAKQSIKTTGAGTANALICGDIVYAALLTNAQVIGTIVYTATGSVANIEAALAGVLGIQTVMVGRAVHTTGNLGQSSLTYVPIIDDDALVCIVTPGVDMMGVSAMKTFTWGPGGGEGALDSYRDESADSEILQHKEQWDQKLITADAGYFFTDIV